MFYFEDSRVNPVKKKKLKWAKELIKMLGIEMEKPLFQDDSGAENQEIPRNDSFELINPL